MDLRQVSHRDLTAAATREQRKLITLDVQLLLFTALSEREKTTPRDLEAGCKEEPRQLWLLCKWSVKKPPHPENRHRG